MSSKEEDILALRARLGGNGEHLPLSYLGNAWEAYSRDNNAGWLLLDDHTFGNFTGWILTCLRGRNWVDIE